MPRDYKTNRLTPDAVQDYKLNPAASVVDKQSRYTPQLEESTKLKQTAQGLADLAKGVTALNIQAARMANENSLEAKAKTKKENQDKWAEVSKNIKGMAKFNPYNKEVYNTLRANANVGNGLLELKQLSTTCADLTYEEFENQMSAIQENVMNGLASENIKARNSHDALIRFQNAQEQLKSDYIVKNKEKEYQIVQNQITRATALNFASNTAEGNYLEGWNKTIQNLANTTNGLGMDNIKQAELFTKAVNQYLIDNIDDIDAEEFMIAVGQTTINGKPLSDFAPNYAESMKQLLVKAKRAKYENDSIDLHMEKLRLEKASLAANAEMFNFLSDPTKSDAEILNKANELIEAGGMEAIGMDYLKSIVSDKQTLYKLRTTQTNPETYESLMRKQLTGELTQDDIVQAVDNKELGVADASSLFNTVQSEAQQTYSEQLKAINELYLDNKPVVDIGEDNKTAITKTVYNTISDPKLSKAEKVQALMRIKGVAEHMRAQKEINESKDPRKLLTAPYMQTQKAHDQSAEEAQRYIAQMGFFKNQTGGRDLNIKVTSPMQASRTVTGTNGKTVTRDHKGSDVSTYLGRAIYAPKTGEVIASGYEESMGNYVLFRCESGGYIKLMHLQAANLPKAGTYLTKGTRLAHVGNTGFVNTKDTGVLHIEFFDKKMRLVDPKQFIKGK